MSSHEDRVVIVTGAGGGLGRSHALLHAERGAKVVVNDLGGDPAGREEGSSMMADKVVAEIEEKGGTAVANHDGVDSTEGAENLVKTAIDAFGRIDVLINNAGILRDISLKKMTRDEWDAVIAVHLTGTYNCTKAAWQHLLDSGSGRVVNTTSAAGLYGNFGQANYSAAKMGIVGFTRTTALEGAKYGLCANVIAPIAKSRMTEDIMPPELLEKLEPEWVSPLVGHLTSPQCTDTGQIFALGGGYYCKVATVETAGKTFGEVPSVEDIAGSWAQISDMTDAAPISNAAEAAAKVVGAVMNT